MLKNFVDAYKVVLSIKESNPIQKKDRYKINSIILLSIILVAVFLVVGYLLQTLQSLNYTFISLNSIVLATYMIYLISKNKYEQFLTNQSYNIHPIVIVEGSRFVSYWLLYNVFIYAIYLNFVGSIIIYVILIVISILVNAFLLLITYKDDNKRMRLNVLKSVLLFLLHFSIILILNVKSIPLSYGLSLAITLIVFFSFQTSQRYKLKKMFYVSTIIITSIFAFTVTKIDANRKIFDLFSFDFHQSNIIKIDYKLEWDSKIEGFNPWNVHMDENYIYYVELITSQGLVIQSFLNVFDKNGNLINRLDYPTKIAYVVKSNQGFYIQFVTNENEKEYLNIYHLSDNLEFELFAKVETEQRIYYIHETEENITIFQEDRIGQYQVSTHTLEWIPISLLEGFTFQTKTHFYFIEDGVAYSSFIINSQSEHVLRNLPFWSNSILAYHDGYAISYQGDNPNFKNVLIEMETQEVTPLTDLNYFITNFIIADGYLIYNQFLKPLAAYHLKEGYIMEGEFDYFYTTHDMSYRVRTYLLNDQIVIEILDFTQGIRKTMRTSSNEIPWVIPVIVVLLATAIVCKRKTRNWS